MNRCVLAVLHRLAQALVAGLTLLGAVGVLVALYLAPRLGPAAAHRGDRRGAGCLAARRAVLQRRVRRAAQVAAAEAEGWLRSLRGRTEGAE